MLTRGVYTRGKLPSFWAKGGYSRSQRERNGKRGKRGKGRNRQKGKGMGGGERKEGEEECKRGGDGCLYLLREIDAPGADLSYTEVTRYVSLLAPWRDAARKTNHIIIIIISSSSSSSSGTGRRMSGGKSIDSDRILAVINQTALARSSSRIDSQSLAVFSTARSVISAPVFTRISSCAEEEKKHFVSLHSLACTQPVWMKIRDSNYNHSDYAIFAQKVQK